MIYKEEQPVFIDFEASSLGWHSFPIEVGVCLKDDFGYSSLIAPFEQWQDWDVKSQSIHHISKEELLKKGKDIVRVAANLNKILKNKIVFSDASRYDNFWCARLFEAADMRPDFKIKSLLYLLNERESDLWNDVKKEVMNEHPALREHRAFNDALLLQKTFSRLKSPLEARHKL